MKLWSAWVALLSRRERGTSLAILRIALGLCVLYTIGAVALPGMVPVLWLDSAHGGYLDQEQTWWLVDALGGPVPGVVWPLVWLTVLSGLALVLGLLPRLAAFTALQTLLALTWINGSAGGSYDEVLSNALWLLVLADSGATLSLWTRLRTGRWRSERLVPAWPRYLVIFQLAVIYASTAAQKVSAYWTPGGDYSALYYVLQQPTWQRIDMRWAAHFFPLTQLMTLATWWWEWAAPLLLLAFWFRDTRTRGGRLRAFFNRLDFRLLYGLFGVGLHLGIFALMEVGPFSWDTLALYLTLIHPDEWRAVARRLARRRASAPPAPATPSP